LNVGDKMSVIPKSYVDGFSEFYKFKGKIDEKVLDRATIIYNSAEMWQTPH